MLRELKRKLDNGATFYKEGSR
jgi:hypothetical protein